MSKTNNLVFTGLQIVVWLIFVGLCIEAFGLLTNFTFSLVKPEFIPYLYNKIDLTPFLKDRPFVFYSIYSFILIIAFLKVFLFYIVIRLMLKLDLTKPFSAYVSRQINQLSYYTLTIGFLSYLATKVIGEILSAHDIIQNIDQYWTDSKAFVLTGAVIYIIANIFKRGVELQHDNDLTV